ncbi:MAG TPA: nuclease-related domain-containing protein [Ureibacillus sp.]|nr:nuclease-related domain-containing protein [Ureibacillus sp.]
MILLERRVPYILLALEALIRRISSNANDFEVEKYKNLYRRFKVGFDGESQSDKEWIELRIPFEYSLIHNYETQSEYGNNYQIDTIFLSKHFIWLLEIKNISGILEYDEEKSQFVRKNFDNTIEGYSNPFEQIEKYTRLIQRRLKNWEINIPIEKAIIVVKDSTIIGNMPKTIPTFHLSGLQSKLDKLSKRYPQASISDKQYKELQKNLLETYQRIVWRPGIDLSKINKGVLCISCNYKTVMRFKHGSFICPVCKTKSQNALIQTILDYKYLQSDWITNRELREFLQIDSIYSVARLCNKLNFAYEGTYKNRKYKIKEYYEQPVDFVKNLVDVASI